jgi:hypothetical protein
MMPHTEHRLPTVEPVSFLEDATIVKLNYGLTREFARGLQFEHETWQFVNELVLGLSLLAEEAGSPVRLAVEYGSRFKSSGVTPIVGVVVYSGSETKTLNIRVGHGLIYVGDAPFYLGEPDGFSIFLNGLLQAIEITLNPVNNRHGKSAMRLMLEAAELDRKANL